MLLAPVVNGRKGEHSQLLNDLKAQGFLRARIDGEVYELDQPPTLDAKKKHNIEVIVDRFKIRADMALRLAESFETALRLSEGLAIVAALDSDDSLLFSERYACPHCGYSLSELEPRIFSFNNPKGACPSCDGLGVRQHFDPQRIITNPALSLAAGAIRGWDKRNGYYFQLISALAAHYGFDLNTPFAELSKATQAMLLFGSGTDSIQFQFAMGDGKVKNSHHPFEGIIPNMERRYHDSDSPQVRDELAQYLTQQSCSACDGARLNSAGGRSSCRTARNLRGHVRGRPRIWRNSVF
jgi:excinuclease ABC subunit A